MKINRITLAEGENIEIDFDGLFPSKRFEVKYTETSVVLLHRGQTVYKYALSPKQEPVRPPVTVPRPINEAGPSLWSRLWGRPA